jgi:hypothetical protein
MSDAHAEQWITVSAVTVAGVYAYRRLTEPAKPPATAKKIVGIGDLPPLGPWATAWGLTFLMVALMAEVSPSLGGSFAILIAAGDLLTNSASVFADVAKQEDNKGAAAAAAKAGASADATASDPNTNPVQAGASSVAGAVGDVAPTFVPPFIPLPPVSVPQVPILTAPLHGGLF